MRELLFLVAGAQCDGTRCYVAGRNCGDLVRIGDAFTVVSPRGQKVGANVQLRVERILTYRKYLNQIDPGMTAEIELVGDHLGDLAAGVDLVGLSPLQPFSTVEILGEGPFHVGRP